MTRLPIYVICNDKSEPLFQVTRSGAVMAHAYKEPQGEITVRYEPAVPKCGTCDAFELRCPRLLAVCLRIGAQVEADGSGYCHRHQEARRD